MRAQVMLLAAALTLSACTSTGLKSIFDVGATSASASTKPMSAADFYARLASSFFNDEHKPIKLEEVPEGKGVRQPPADVLAYAVSSQALADADRGPLLSIPIWENVVVIIVNLPGVRSGQLLLDGPILRDIFLGRIPFWDDPALLKLNPDLAAFLPHQAIQPICRGDNSSSINLATQRYVNGMGRPRKSGDDATAPGIAWPPTCKQFSSDHEVVSAVAATRYSLGYAEYFATLERPVAVTRLKNRREKILTPSPETFKASSEMLRYDPSTARLVLRADADRLAWPIFYPTNLFVQNVPDDTGFSFAIWLFETQADALTQQGKVPISPATALAIERRFPSALDRTRGGAPPQ